MKDFPVYECPIKRCKRFVVGKEGAQWSCGDHGVPLVRVNPKKETMSE